MEESNKGGQTGCHSVVEKEQTGSNLECGDNDDTPSLVDDESANDALKWTNQLGNNKCDVCCDNHIKWMTITHGEKDEVSLLSGPSWSAFMLLEDSMFNKEAEPRGQAVMEAADEGNEQNFWTACETQITCS